MAQVYIWQIARGKLLKKFDTFHGKIDCCVEIKANIIALTYSESGCIQFYDLDNLEEPKDLGLIFLPERKDKIRQYICNLILASPNRLAFFTYSTVHDSFGYPGTSYQLKILDFEFEIVNGKNFIKIGNIKEVARIPGQLNSKGQLFLLKENKLLVVMEKRTHVYDLQMQGEKSSTSIKYIIGSKEERVNYVTQLNDGKILFAHSEYLLLSNNYRVKLTLWDPEGTDNRNEKHFKTFQLPEPWTSPEIRQIFQRMNGEILIVRGLSSSSEMILVDLKQQDSEKLSIKSFYLSQHFSEKLSFIEDGRYLLINKNYTKTNKSIECIKFPLLKQKQSESNNISPEPKMG